MEEEEGWERAAAVAPTSFGGGGKKGRKFGSLGGGGEGDAAKRAMGVKTPSMFCLQTGWGGGGASSFPPPPFDPFRLKVRSVPTRPTTTTFALEAAAAAPELEPSSLGAAAERPNQPWTDERAT